MARVDCGLQTPFWLRLRRGVCGVSMRAPARMLRELTRRVCLNGAPQARGELRGAPRKRTDAGLPLRCAKGSQTVGRVSLPPFLSRNKKGGRPPGRDPASALNRPTRRL